MNKICTSLEQSKKLLELGININTADMCWSIDIPDLPTLLPYSITDCDNWENKISAWSLTALLDILPNYQLQTQDDGIGILCSCNGKFNIVTADNPVDACVELIVKLKEKNLL